MGGSRGLRWFRSRPRTSTGPPCAGPCSRRERRATSRPTHTWRRSPWNTTPSCVRPTRISPGFRIFAGRIRSPGSDRTSPEAFRRGRPGVLYSEQHTWLPYPGGISAMPDTIRNRRSRFARRRALAPALPAFALLALVPALLAAQGAKRPMSIDDIMNMRNVGAPNISPNGALVTFTVGAWEHPNAKSEEAKGNGAKSDTAKGDRHETRSHVWMVPTDGSQPARQLTFGERGENAPSFSPDGSTIAFLSARGTAAAGQDAPRTQ